MANPGAGGARSSKADTPQPEQRAPAAPEVVVVIVTIDGVRWHEVFEGVDPRLAEAHGLPLSGVVGAADLTPNLHRIVATHGAALGAPGHGAPINASGPNFVSLPGYAELLSGRRVTDCKDNLCTSSGRRTLFDDFAAASARDAAQAVAFTSWPDIAKVASERGPFAEPTARPPSFRPDALTADLAIQHLRERAPKFLFLGLGEPDEFGHQNDYAGYLRSLRYADQRIGEIDQILQDLAALGTRTALFVTADHGRADSFVEHGAKFPESARVWLVASGSAVHATGFVAAPTPRRLADLAPTVRQITGLPHDANAAAGTPLDELLRESLF
ncbi:MAG: alkaline phosphatase family protein [Polyangiaceae bacterium]